jgi:ABC-2 type transport system permease protein
MSETTAAAPRAGDHHPGAYPARDRTVGRRLAPPGDYLTMAARCARLTSREIDAAAMSLFLPVMLMVIFVYLFGGAVSTGTRYITYVVPGVLLLCAGIGSITTAVPVCRDMTGGIIDRFRSMDVGGLPILSGHVAASVARNAASTVLVVAVALGIGFRPHAGPAAWAAVIGLLLLYVLAVSWLAAAIGLLVSSPEAANAFMFLPMIVTYASSAFVPVRTMPSWLHGFASHQPATPVIETIRGLMLGTHVGNYPGASGWQALAWCGGIFAGSVALSAAAFRRRAR